MAHELDETTGEHAFTRVAGSQPAWHGLGGETPADAPLEVWLQNARLDYSVRKAPSYIRRGPSATGDAFDRVDNAHHLVRDDTMTVISAGTVTDAYSVVQPAEIAEFFREFVLVDGRFTMETMGALRGGRQIWALARFAEQYQVGGAAHDMYALMATSYDASMATLLRGTSVCVVCANTLHMSHSDGANSTLRIRHNTKFAGVARDRAAAEFSELLAGQHRFKAMGDSFAQIRMSADAVSAFFKTLLDIPLSATTQEISGRKMGQFAALKDALRTANRAEAGNAPMTKFAALQAVTRYVDHERSTNDRAGFGKDDAKVFSAQFGSGAALKSRAVSLLLAA